MESILRELYQERASDPHTLGVLLVEKKSSHHMITDGFDAILLLIVNEVEESWFVKHYEYASLTIALHVIDEELLNRWLITGENRLVIDWAVNGKIIFDRNEFVLNLKKRLDEFPIEDRKQKITVEFAKLIRRYSEAKELFHSGDHLDAFNNVMHALHHLARLGVIEKGYYPEVTVWKQVKQIDPEIFKLYNELVTGDEAMDKRLELLLLASEFSIASKTKVGCISLLELMNSKDEAWTYKELMQVFDLKNASVNLSILIEHLIRKGFVDAVKIESKSKGIFHRLYKTNEKYINL
ncbi:nucleotidyltransferase-like protein [Anaerobacillus sp. MEB173]|uniref:nucleotidyltransferase-like protein n=1 Tax=Anaerobacillus sp. MEB173 TaxID=3383345 RepID=UPI003F8FA1ED